MTTSRSKGTAIEWTDATWNPVTGCTKVSPGCDHCYAERIASRGGKGFPNGFALTLHPERLNVPLRDRRPKRIFVNSMSDLFHDDIPDDYIGKVFAVMAQAHWHTFQVLTKRPGRMRSWVRRHQPDPLPNVWLGVSAEDQKWADIRIPVLLDTTAAIRFISAEPLLGPIDLSAYLAQLDWIIVGGESGPQHRAMQPDWARSIRDQCTPAGVAFLFKQWGGRTPKAGGRELDGHQWDQYPDTIGEEVSNMADGIDRSDEYLETFAEIDGAELLDELHATLTRYVVFPDQHASAAVTLWIAATHALPAFDAAPRLVFTSPEKRCGKSRALDVIAGTCHSPLPTVNATVAAIFRSLDKAHPPTLLIDEADTIFGSKKVAENNEDFRALLNAGFQRGRPALRCVGPLSMPTPFKTFAMAALAGIREMPDTITDRAINVLLRRRAAGERVSQFRARRDGLILADLRTRLADWVGENMDKLTDAEPVMPVEDRAADTWEPLVAVADTAGDHWPQTARSACVALVAAAEVADEDHSYGVKLLSDIRDIFAGWHVSFIPSAELVSELRRIEDSPWQEFEYTPGKLAYYLREFGVKPKRAERNTVRGYWLADFRDAFERYTRPQSSSRPQTGDDQARREDDLKGEDESSRPHDSTRPQENAGQTLFEDVRTGEDDPPGEKRSFRPPTGSGRCPECGWHIEKQGHRDDCSANPDNQFPF
jgi:protein gp37